MMNTIPTGHIHYGRRGPTTRACRSDASAKRDDVATSIRSALLAAAKDAIFTLRLGPSATALLSLLVSCFGTDQVVEGLMVWPSNTWLQARSGQSERTIQRAIRRLCDEGLIAVIGSANGKRFARRNRNGRISQAFGFSLEPLFQSRGDLAATAMQMRDEKEACQVARRQLGAARRAVLGAIELAVRHGHFDLSQELQAAFEPLSPRRSLSASLATLNECAGRLQALATTAQEDLKHRDELTGSRRQTVGHKEEKQESSIKGGSRSHVGRSGGEAQQGVAAAATKVCQGNTDREFIQAAATGLPNSISLGMFDVEVWKKACPAACDAGLALNTMTDFVEAGCFLSYCIGADREALLEGTAKLGRAGSGLVSLCVYQLMMDAELAGRPMSNPGGRFRSLLRAVASGVRSLDQEISALKTHRLERAVIRTDPFNETL